MLRTAFVAALTGLGLVAMSVAQEPADPLAPNKLLNWLRIIDDESFRILSAVDQRGYFFAVKQDPDGDLIFCEYRHDDPSKDNPRSYSLSVTDPKDGRDLDGPYEGKRFPDTAKVKYNDSLTVAYSRGALVRLKNRDLPSVHVVYCELLANGTKKVLFDQVVELRKRK